MYWKILIKIYDIDRLKPGDLRKDAFMKYANNTELLKILKTYSEKYDSFENISKTQTILEL